MAILFVAIGMILPTFIGWATARLIEGKNPVLFTVERAVVGFVLGGTATMYITFLVHTTTGMPLSFIGFLTIQLLITAIVGTLLWVKRSTVRTKSPMPRRAASSRLAAALLIATALLTISKLLLGGTFLIASPVYFDDVYKNWNFRGKMFYVEERITLEIPQSSGTMETGGVSSYPPTVSMLKAWFAHIQGSWNEGTVSAIHILWYLCALLLVYFALRRLLSMTWSVLGMYILSGLPLYLIHGSVAYADVFLSLHVFLAVSFLFFAVQTEEEGKRISFFALSALSTALLVFTKNEALLLHLPPLAVLVLLSLWYLRKRDITKQAVQQVVLWYAVCITTVLLPWLIYKWSHGLTFGNAKGISDLELGWQEGVLSSIWVNTFFEANWNLFFPLCIGVGIVTWKAALRTPLIILSAFFLMVYFGQYPLYMFTPLSTEAIQQTGYARGLIQLMPIAVLLVTVLLSTLFTKKQQD